jgi:hypothetical protein
MRRKKKHLYMLSDRGLGSEINNLLYAINYSNKNKLEFILESSLWNFKIKKGWQDYFESLTIESSRISFRLKILKLIIKLMGKNYTNLHFWWDKSSLPLQYAVFKKIICLIKGKYIVTSFETFSDLRAFSIQEMELDINTFKSSINKILINIWKLKLEFYPNLIKLEGLENKYITIHIRRGDKVATREDDLYTVQNYIDIMLNLSTTIQTIFLMSDDFSVYSEFKEKLPGYDILTLVDPEKRGHKQSDFNQLSTVNKKNEMIGLLVEIEIARNCVFFIGSHRSNLYRLIEYFKLNNCYSVSDSKLVDP